MSTRRTGTRRTLLAATVCLALAGCEQQTLYVGLSQTEANEMLSVMYASGLPAEKLPDEDGGYSVTTSKEAFAHAMGLLQNSGLPREQFESIGEIFEKESFVSSSLEERARLNFALSQEIARTVSSIDGVVMARVHLVMPERERLSQGRLPASASVFVKHRPDVDLSDSVGKIKSLVINGVEGLPYENVTVAFFDAQAYEPPRAAPAQDPAPTAPAAPDAIDPLRNGSRPIEATLAPGPNWLVAPLLPAGLAGYLLWRRRAAAAAKAAPAEGARDDG